MTTVVISQPMYFPWPGFFELASTADVYIHLDDVQFSKGSFTNRIQIKHPSGMKWLTIPLHGKGTCQIIKDLAATGPDWRQHHRALIAQCLSGAPHIEAALHLFDQVVATEPLADLLENSVDLAAAALRICTATKRLKTSQMNVPGSSWRRVLDLVHAVGGTRYVTAHGGYRYLDHQQFENEGVSVEYVDYSLTAWPQFHGPFTPYVSILDLLAQCGGDAAERLRPRTISWREMLSRMQNGNP